MGSAELQLPVLFICDAPRLSVSVTSASCSHVFQLISHIYLTGEPPVFAFCIVASFAVVPNCSFTFRRAFLCLLICVKEKNPLNLHFSLYSFYCLSYSLHAANTQSRRIKGIPPCLISFRIIFHRHLKINFLFSYFMIWGKQLKNFLSVSESTIVMNGSFTLHQAPLFLKVTASRNTSLLGFISPRPMKAKKID